MINRAHQPMTDRPLLVTFEKRYKISEICSILYLFLTSDQQLTDTLVWKKIQNQSDLFHFVFIFV